MQQSDQYKDRGMSHGQPVPQIPAAFGDIREEGSEHRGAESKKGDCGVFHLWKANSLLDRVMGVPTSDSQRPT